jgi:GNAT superfamily N-acetyltransferase
MSSSAVANVEKGERFAPLTKVLTEITIEMMGTRPYYYLNLLFTHPDHYRKGVGRLLTRWGTERADEKGVECYLEGSIEGKPLYLKEGFVERREMAFSIKEYGDEEEDVLSFMIRPGKGRDAR